jgi:hypothetical protein
MHTARTRLQLVTTVVVIIALEAVAIAQRSGQTAVEMVHIDGGRNPELIPQWSAWGYAFRIFAGGPRQLPTSVLEHVSKAEETFLLSQADLVQQIDARCQDRLTRLMARRLVEKRDALERQVRELALECRGATLQTRDRVLAAINPEAQLALIAFVESTKAGTSITIPRTQLARFREPE